MLVAVPMGVTAAVMGHALVRSLLWTRERMKSVSSPIWLRATGGGFCVSVLGLSAYALTGLLGESQFGVFSIGYGSLDQAFSAQLAAGALIVLLVFKFAVVISYSSGGSGGLFSPTQFLGGMLGGLFGLLLVWLDGQFGFLDDLEGGSVIGACVLLEMGSMFASVVRCPFTSLLIIFEMTRSYSLMLPLMVGNVISYFMASRWQAVPLYNALLLQDGVSLRQMPAYRGAQDYQQVPVLSTKQKDRVLGILTLNDIARQQISFARHTD